MKSLATIPSRCAAVAKEHWTTASRQARTFARHVPGQPPAFRAGLEARHSAPRPTVSLRPALRQLVVTGCIEGPKALSRLAP